MRARCRRRVERRAAIGSVTERLADKLGRLDPRTGTFHEFLLPTPGSGPHGLVADAAGQIWFTAISKGYIGQLDPKTGHVREYPANHRGGADPHTPVFDEQGIVWYSESGVEPNTLVRFVPEPPGFASTPIPSGGGVVRNMVATPGGQLYLAESGVNKVAVATPSAHKLPPARRDVPRD